MIGKVDAVGEGALARRFELRVAVAVEDAEHVIVGVAEVLFAALELDGLADDRGRIRALTEDDDVGSAEPVVSRGAREVSRFGLASLGYDQDAAVRFSMCGPAADVSADIGEASWTVSVHAAGCGSDSASRSGAMSGTAP